MHKKLRIPANLHELLPSLIYLLAAVVLLIGFSATPQQPAAATFCDGMDPAAVCPPSGVGYICICAGGVPGGDSNCVAGCLNIPPITCEDIGMTGAPWPGGCVPVGPVCVGHAGQACSSGQNSCGLTSSGTYDCDGNCSASTPSDTLCPLPPPPDPTCADFGLLGTWPACYAPPPPPTCADFGLLGVWPNCYAPPPDPTCADSGMLGTWPNCFVPPNPTCADFGQLGTYPNCYDAPSDPAPNVTLTANPTSIVSGGSSTLTWSSSDATSCTGGGFSTGNATSGTRSVSPASSQTYTVQCTGPGGSNTDDATVTVTGGACSGAGPITATATPARLTPGESTVITWSGSNVASASCSVTNLNTGSAVGNSIVTSCGTSGSANISNLQGQTTFRIACGALTRDVTVNLVPSYEEF